MLNYDQQLACRLLKASRLAYTISGGSVDTTSQDYRDIGFTEEPIVFTGGALHIDACYIGKTAEFAMLVIRGTLPPTMDKGLPYLLKCIEDWVNDGEAALVPAPDGVPGMVHKGFNDALSILWDRILGQLKALNGLPLYIAGHSKGGAVAYLAAMRAASTANKIDVAGVYTFAAARCGDGDFADACDGRFAGKLWRFEFQNDIVPHLPPSFGVVWDVITHVVPGLPDFSTFGYESAGTLQFIDWDLEIVEDDAGLGLERLDKLAECLAKGKPGVDEVIDDHSLDTKPGYASVICKPQ